ncbi:FHA domain-containing protein [Marinisporobacter balticus]|uniref:FHA domain-containing protein n=1 Tax=Marinisporobacter balticus TaxID=2018667 RepID=A0A4R2KDC7_9FIRM|nr:FHA domain-containing protein [Marinisporobacter balticus]TCO71503.1 FHA domain-containing protein [Marinisporobacter balticus]
MKKSISHNITIIDLTIAILSIVTCIYIYMIMEHRFIEYILIFIVGIIAIFYIGRVFASDKKEDMQHTKTRHVNNINNLALLNEENQIIREWDLLNKTSLVIGRNTKQTEVDIDLSTSTYASLIDPQHAVLNFVSGRWYIEDLYSENGISIQKAEDKIRYKLSKDKPCTIIKGDVVFIAKTKLLIR